MIEWRNVLDVVDEDILPVVIACNSIFISFFTFG